MATTYSTGTHYEQISMYVRGADFNRVTKGIIIRHRGGSGTATITVHSPLLDKANSSSPKFRHWTTNKDQTDLPDITNDVYDVSSFTISSSNTQESMLDVPYGKLRVFPWFQLKIVVSGGTIDLDIEVRELGV